MISKFCYVYLALVYSITRCARVLEKKEERCATPWSVCFGLIWRFWYILGDHDALALCSWRIGHWWWLCYLGGALLHVGDLVHDALVLGGSCLWSATLGGDSWLMWWRLWGDLGGWWCFDWWHGGFALLMTWSFGWWRIGLDDDLEAWMMSWLMEVFVLFFSIFYQ